MPYPRKGDKREQGSNFMHSCGGRCKKQTLPKTQRRL